MSKRYRFKVEKLIRDNIPCSNKEDTITCKRTLDDIEFIDKLKNKLLEEANEVLYETEAESILMELSDVCEVIYTLTEQLGFTKEELENKRLSKREKRGGFDKRIYNEWIEMSEDNSDIKYYLNDKKYPIIEIK